MQGIDKREHRNLEDVFKKYKSSYQKAEVELEDNLKICQNMEELDVLYNSFMILLSELQRCAKSYEKKKITTRSILHKNLRKLNAKVLQNK
ncbi:hypothetical protein ACFFLS_11725 [Flavobacterium procerum]|uniref:Uncharacterized protein n=1 Tax=Flavobacterium procerum TaxID=1455569 RepID=A0ABV6BUM0_9FLAO